jgi:HD-like signal output (HDOD) protein
VLEPAEAVSFLGFNTLRSVLIASSVFDQLASSAGARDSACAAVAHGRKVAAAARLIAHTEHAPRKLVDECFTAGLLHDIGKLVLAACLPDSFPQEHAQPMTLEQERESFGATHAEVGAYLLGLWGLPDAAVEAARLHHAPLASPARDFLPLTAAHVADCLVPRTEAEGATPSARLDEQYLAEIGRAERLPIWRAAVQQLHSAPTSSSAIP